MDQLAQPKTTKSLLKHPSYHARLSRPFKKSTKPSFLAPHPTQTQTSKLEATTSIPVTVNFTDDLCSVIYRALNYNPIFYALPRNEVQSLISKLGFYEIGPDEVIYEQGYPPTNFYILTEGKAIVRSNGKVIKELGPGSSFGETALINGNPREHSVVATQSTSFLSLEQEDFNTFLKLAQTLNYEDLRNFNYTLKQLEGLQPSLIDALSKFSVLQRFLPGTDIITKGESGSMLYFILEGEAVVVTENEEVRRLYPCDSFGEQALLYEGIRTATVRAVTEMRCEAVPKQVLYRTFGSNLDDFIYTNTARIAFDRCKNLKNLSSSEKEHLIKEMQVSTHAYDEIVIPMGSGIGDSLIIVLNGSLYTRRGMDIRESKHFASLYECIGSEEITSGFVETVLELDVVADSDEVAIGEISKEAFHACLGTDSVPRAVSTKQFKGIQILEELPREKQSAIAREIEVREYKDNEIICRQNEPGNHFYILKSGRAVIVRNGMLVRTITKSDYFGEKSLLIDRPRTASIYAEGRCVVWVLNRESFNRFFDERAKTAMKNRIERTDVTLTLQDLIPVYLLGKGMFGCVFLVASRSGPELYALKAVDRKKITSENHCKYVLMERNILMQITHKFVMKLVTTFKDDGYVYFLLEYIKGQTLFNVLHECGRFTIDEATFYMAIIVQILEYLHERDIMHRDLKPENILVTEDGYLKLVDFGTAKVIQGRTRTRVGTPWYMAPEIIQDKEYGISADLWSAGVILYELVCGRTPFGEDEEDPYIVMKRILSDELIFPSFFHEPSDCKTLICQLLKKNPFERISLHDVRRHRFFRNFDWDELNKGTIVAKKFPREEKNLQKMIESAKRRMKTVRRELEKESEDDDEEEPQQTERSRPPPNWDDSF